MFILGLTGSIGMGKTTAATIFRRLNVPVYDADEVVHELLGRNGAGVDLVGEAFEGIVSSGCVDRQALAEQVFDDVNALSVLEAIVHPIVRSRQIMFLRMSAKLRRPLVVLDVPLLFETGGDNNCDAVAVVSAPQFLQRIRVMARPGMTEEKFQTIQGRQIHDQEKRRRADFIIPSGLGKRRSLQSVQEIIRVVLSIPATHWPPGS